MDLIRQKNINQRNQNNLDNNDTTNSNYTYQNSQPIQNNNNNNNNIDNNNNTKQNSNFINYNSSFTEKIDIINEEKKIEFNYSLNDIFIIDEKEKKSDELNINQIGLNENNPYDFL